MDLKTQHSKSKVTFLGCFLLGFFWHLSEVDVSVFHSHQLYLFYLHYSHYKRYVKSLNSNQPTFENETKFLI